MPSELPNWSVRDVTSRWAVAIVLVLARVRIGRAAIFAVFRTALGGLISGLD
jgi:hypothetical protein